MDNLSAPGHLVASLAGKINSQIIETTHTQVRPSVTSEKTFHTWPVASICDLSFALILFLILKMAHARYYC